MPAVLPTVIFYSVPLQAIMVTSEKCLQEVRSRIGKPEKRDVGYVIRADPYLPEFPVNQAYAVHAGGIG